VYREHLPAIKVNVNYDKMFTEIRKALAATPGQPAFNMGEMLDSLALDHVTNLTTELVPFFASLRRGCLMLLTKSANINNLMRLEPNERTVVSWSLNAQRMIAAYEPSTAALVERVEAARRCQRHGYRVRFRIDPGMLYADWRPGYAEVVQRALAAVQPENITLGMLRLVPGHFDLAARAYGQRGRDLRQHDLVESASDGKLRYRTEKRVEFYRFMIDTIRSFNPNVSISLCRETPDVWSHFTHVCDPQRCNCLAW
jgi:spore photoproduct lyase